MSRCKSASSRSDSERPSALNRNSYGSSFSPKRSPSPSSEASSVSSVEWRLSYSFILAHASGGLNGRSPSHLLPSSSGSSSPVLSGFFSAIFPHEKQQSSSLYRH